MKKCITFIIIIMTLFLITIKFQVYYEKEKTKTLSGTKISNYMNKYNLDIKKNSELASTHILNENIFYLENNYTSHTLYKKDIYTGTANEIKTFSTNWCSFSENYVNCKDDSYEYFYNLSTNQELKVEYNEDIYIIPYKDTYLKLYKDTLTFIENNPNIIFREIKKDYIYESFYYTKDNTYLLLNNNNTYYLYNIKELTYTKINALKYNSYQNGIYFLNDNNIIIYDLKNTKTKEYNIDLVGYLDLLNTLDADNKNLYLIKENNLEIINLEQNTKKLINLNISNITNITINEKYLYLEDLQNNAILVLNLNNYPEKNIKTIISEINNGIDLTTFKSYNINIKLKEEAIIDFPDFYAESFIDESNIKEILPKLENIINKFNPEFFKSFYENDKEGLFIHLTGTLSPSDYTTQASTPAAYSLTYNNKYMIVIDINQPNIEELLCHELMHNIEFNLKNNNKDIFLKWEALNPKDFYYTNSYTTKSNFNYTKTEENIDNVYFIDRYSHTYKSEDLARIFEKVCSVSNDSIINDYPNLKKKGLYLKEELLNDYPILKDTILFDSLN